MENLLLQRLCRDVYKRQGYSSADALRAVRKVTDVPPDDVEGLLKAALKNF